MAALHRFIRGIRDSIPSGYVLGRTDSGIGNVHLIKIGDLTQNAVNAVQTGGIITGANPTAVGKDTAINGVSKHFMRADAAPAIQKCSASQFGLCEVDGTTITASGGVISASGGSGAVNSICQEIVSSGASGDLFASLGIFLTPVVNLTLLGIAVTMSETNLATYKFGVAPFNSSTLKITSAATYAPATYTGSSTSHPRCPALRFTTPFAMTAGSTYALWETRTDATNTTNGGADFSNTDLVSPGFNIKAAGVNGIKLASLAPQTTDVWTVASALFCAYPIYAIA